MKHTPGPWRPVRSLWLLEDDKGARVLAPHDYDPDRDGGATYLVSVESDDDWIALVRSANADDDARLIAKAPEMRELLNDLVGMSQTAYKAGSRALDETLDDARALLVEINGDGD